MLGAFIAIYLEFGTMNFEELFASTATASTELIGVLLAIGALIKSRNSPSIFGYRRLWKHRPLSQP